MKKNILSTLVFFLFGFSSLAQDLNVSKWIQPVDLSARFRLDSFMVWCGSAVKGDDNKYYLFYSRWPRKLGHLAWATHSEVAVAVADHPTGPYTHVKVVLPKRDKQFWDADVTHNPTVHKFGKTYYLYYMGNYGNGEWWDHRNHQRIGLATSKSPLGPWKRVLEPLVDTTTNGFDHVIASNPSVMKRLDGKYQMIYKGVSKGPMPFGGVVTHGAALADKPEGPFVKTPYKIFIKDTVKFAAEDPYIWAQDGKYWAIVKDMKGVFTNAGTSLALFESADGFDWKLSRHALVSTTVIPWKSGAKKVEKLERPQLLIEAGKPTVLFCAVYDGNDNYNVAIPLDSAPKDPVAMNLPGKGFQLLYEDHFVGNTLNERDWQYRTGRRTGMGYMDGLNLKENVFVKDSALHIAVRHEMIDGKWENTGGGIISKHNFGYGYYESLSKPFMEGHGVHTSFWQRGGANPNNNIFEIDSYEIDSKTWVATNNLYVDIPYNGYTYTPWPHRAQVPFRFQKDGWFHDAYEFSP
ncbi:MAG: family 16 glycosylhydrolase, partial [Chitinophagaceae bacterium]|nr:family 16 glycosylhydrolase [Chitinophagaceae bacterium]